METDDSCQELPDVQQPDAYRLISSEPYSVTYDTNSATTSTTKAIQNSPQICKETAFRNRLVRRSRVENGAVNLQVRQSDFADLHALAQPSVHRHPDNVEFAAGKAVRTFARSLKTGTQMLANERPQCFRRSANIEVKSDVPTRRVPKSAYDREADDQHPINHNRGHHPFTLANGIVKLNTAPRWRFSAQMVPP